MGTDFFYNYSKKTYHTSEIAIDYSAQYPVKTPIVYNYFKNDSKEQLFKATQDSARVFGPKWGLYGIDDKEGEFNVLNNLLSLNPEEGKKSPRTKSNCKHVRFLYEWDTISLDDQKKITQQLIEKGVLLRAVFSGSKSIHHIIELWSEREPKNKEEYQFMHEFIARRLKLQGYDTQCKDNSRLTRACGCYRKNKGKWQTLLYYNNAARFKCDDWYTYYLSEKKARNTPSADKLIRAIKSIKNTNDKADFEFVERYIKSEERKGSFKDGNRHANFGRVISALKLKGKLSCEEVKAILEPYIANTNNNDLRNGIEKLYNGAEE